MAIPYVSVCLSVRHTLVLCEKVIFEILSRQKTPIILVFCEVIFVTKFGQITEVANTCGYDN